MFYSNVMQLIFFFNNYIFLLIKIRASVISGVVPFVWKTESSVFSEHDFTLSLDMKYMQKPVSWLWKVIKVLNISTSNNATRTAIQSRLLQPKRRACCYHHLFTHKVCRRASSHPILNCQNLWGGGGECRCEEGGGVGRAVTFATGRRWEVCCEEGWSAGGVWRAGWELCTPEWRRQFFRPVWYRPLHLRSHN